MQIIKNSRLTGFTGAINTTAPNATVNVAQLLANVVSTNGDIVLSPKGNGAILAQVPDGTTTGGNKRGIYAVDLQTFSRTTSTQVASGSYSVLIGGSYNTAGGSYSTVIGGTSSLASGNNSTVLNSIASTASGIAALILGGSSNIASGNYSTVIGQANTASGSYSFAFGTNATTNSIFGKIAFSSGNFTTLGDCQIGTQVLRRLATNTTPVVLTADNATPSATNQIQLQNNQTIKVKCDILARSSTGLTKNVEATASLKRGANAASTTISNPVYTTVFQDTGTENWTMVLSADTTNGCGAITFTIDSVSNVRCMAKVETVELIY